VLQRDIPKCFWSLSPAPCSPVLCYVKPLCAWHALQVLITRGQGLTASMLSTRHGMSSPSW
jgi:hypothetical protein